MKILLLKLLRHPHTPAVSVMCLLAVVIFRNYIFTAIAPAGIDSKGFIARGAWIANNSELFSIWSSQYSFGDIRLPSVDNLLAFLNIVIDNPVLVDKLVIIGFFLLAGLSMYFVSYQFTRSRFASAVAMVTFVILPHSLSLFISSIVNMLPAYALAPLLFFTLDRALLKKGSLKFVFLFSLITSLVILFGRADYLIFHIPFLGMYVLFYIVRESYKQWSWPAVLTGVKVVGLSFVMVAVLSAPFFLPVVAGMFPNLGGTATGFSLEDVAFRSNDLLQSFLMMPRAWSYLLLFWGIGDDVHPFLGNGVYYSVLAIIPVIALLPVILRRNWRVVFLTVSFLLAVFLAKGTHPPLGGIYEWFFTNIPFFSYFRIPNRWLLVGGLAASFLFGIGIKLLWDAINNAKLGAFFNQNLKGALQSTLVLVVVGAMIIPVFPSFTQGLLVWDYPANSLPAYQWVGEQPGDFRVISLPYPPYNYEAHLDPSRVDKLWWEHDMGLESSLYHNKTVMGISEAGRDDFGYYMMYLSNNMETDNLMKIMGAYGVKYTVHPAHLYDRYPDTYSGLYRLPEGFKTRNDYFPAHDEYIAQQNGLEERYSDEANNAVYENTYYTPKIFAPSKWSLVVGGMTAYKMMAEVAEMDFSKQGMVFADQTLKNQGKEKLVEFIVNSDRVVFANSGLSDLASMLIDDAVKLDAAEYATAHNDRNAWWIADSWTMSLGMLHMSRSGRTLSTSSISGKVIPLSIEDEGDYEIWVRLAFAPDRGSLVFSVDDAEVGRVVPFSINPAGMQWVKVGTKELAAGDHNLQLYNLSTVTGTANDIDQIMLVTPEVREEAFAQLDALLAAKGEDSVVMFLSPLQRFIGTAQPFEEDRFTAYDISNGDPSSYWVSEDKAKVNITAEVEETDYVSQPADIKIELEPSRERFTIMSHEYKVAQDWADSVDIEWWFKGTGSGEIFNMSFFFNSSFTSSVAYYFEDTSTEWRKLRFSMMRDGRVHGIMDWSKVSRVVFGSRSKTTSGEFHLSRLRRIAPIKEELVIDVPRDGEYQLEIQANPGIDYSKMVMSTEDGDSIYGSIDALVGINGEMIYDGSSVSFWDNANPEYVVFSRDDEETAPSGESQSSVKMEMQKPGRTYYAIAEKLYDTPQDWSQSNYITFWFKGTGGGDRFSLSVHFKDSDADYSIFEIDDVSTEWKKIALRMDNPKSIHGDVDWSAVSALKLSSAKDVLGTFNFDQIVRYEDMISYADENWFDMEPAIELEAGENRLNIERTGKVDISQYLLYSVAEGSAETLEDELTATGDRAGVSYVKISPTRYRVSVNSLEPGWLVFGEAYNDLWKAHIDEAIMDPVPVYTTLNGYYLENTGSYDVIIEFAGQKYLTVSWIICLAAAGIAFLLVSLVLRRVNGRNN